METLTLVLAAAAPADPADVSRAVRLFGALALLLSAFMLAVILISALRRRRLARRAASGTQGQPGVVADAWSEAGRRGEAFGPPPEDAQAEDAQE